ncbi:leucyl aminopeptidase [Pseudoxanthomonas sacheonensis]|uniref:Leucyl aminopeptidase n=1 Tax=Pseudoxanthomonas sacheonensis TaxID=443615 RepID=A0ABU1RR29_9GAMM|nr:leucyl aminopeptidase [Pseudoxanthomonas sacheonensis]
MFSVPCSHPRSAARMAGAVTAALCLERFVPAQQKWAHLDVYAWNDSDRAGRPPGRWRCGRRLRC